MWFGIWENSHGLIGNYEESEMEARSPITERTWKLLRHGKEWEKDHQPDDIVVEVYYQIVKHLV